MKGITAMKFGMCLGHNKAHLAAEIGADYAELNCGAIYDISDSDFNALKEKVKNKEIITYSCNGLVKADVRLTGDVNFDTVKEYAKKAFGRMIELGVTMMVFGSGKAKHVPDGFSFEKAWEQLYEVGAIFSDVAAQNGQMIAIEPLRYEEVNIVNTLEDAANYSRTVNRDNFKILADFYHVNANNEPLSDIQKYAELLVHTHIASPDRAMLTEEHHEFVAERINALKSIGYTGGISFEGASPDGFVGVDKMFELMRSI